MQVPSICFWFITAGIAQALCVVSDRFLARAKEGIEKARFVESGKAPQVSPSLVDDSERSASSGNQVEDKHDQREHKQKMDQPAAEVKTKAEEPQDQNHRKDCPKHISLSQNGSALGLKSAVSAHNASDEVLN
jgi:hypothetical protein